MIFSKYHLFFLSGLFIFISCDNSDKLVSFNLNTKNQIKIPPFSENLLSDNDPENDKIDVLTDEIRFSEMEAFLKNHTDHADVKDIEAFDLVVNIDSGATDLSFGKDFVFYLSPSGQYFNDFALGSLQGAESGRKTYTFRMPSSDSQWLDVFSKGIYRLRLNCRMLKGLPKPVYISFSMSFRLKAMSYE